MQPQLFGNMHCPTCVRLITLTRFQLCSMMNFTSLRLRRPGCSAASTQLSGVQLKLLPVHGVLPWCVV
jgi:hypothetical protein